MAFVKQHPYFLFHTLSHHDSAKEDFEVREERMLFIEDSLVSQILNRLTLAAPPIYRVSLYNIGCPGTCCVDLTGLEILLPLPPECCN